ncbi:MAG: CbtA family protein, partial [Paracoccaceae bacterium]|nr:CbtA family protein [Paracoccaceae bacterium]
MIFHRLASGLIAGAIAGLLAALLHFSFVQEYILLSESYETGTVTHFPDGHVGHDAPQTQSDNSQTDTTGADSQLKPLQHVHG